MDTLNGRHAARRDQVCPTNWIEGHQCPEPDQPEHFWYYITNKKEFNQRKIQMMQRKQQNGPQTQDPAQFGQVKISYDLEGNIKETWSEIGAKFSCDEWPAASYARISFSSLGLFLLMMAITDGLKEARERILTVRSLETLTCVRHTHQYCVYVGSPISASCTNRSPALNTEQNWQGIAHGVIKVSDWAGEVPCPDANRLHERNGTIRSITNGPTIYKMATTSTTKFSNSTLR